MEFVGFWSFPIGILAQLAYLAQASWRQFPRLKVFRLITRASQVMNQTVVVSTYNETFNLGQGKGGGWEQRETIMSKQCNENNRIIRKRSIYKLLSSNPHLLDHLSPLWQFTISPRCITKRKNKIQDNNVVLLNLRIWEKRELLVQNRIITNGRTDGPMFKRKQRCTIHG